jgi:hypothetical protein
MQPSALDRSGPYVVRVSAEVLASLTMPSLRERPSDLLTISRRRVRREVLVVVLCPYAALVDLSFK